VNLIRDAVRALTEARNILITSHLNPDGDAVGSLLGLGLAMKMNKKDVTMYLEDPVPRFLRFLPGADCTVHELNGVASFDLAVVLDCADIKRIGAEWPRLKSISKVVNIDHHESNTGFGIIRVVKSLYSSTAELIYNLLQAMNHFPNRDQAINLYTGMMTDTGRFCYGNLNRECFMAAANLVEAGADPQEIASAVYGQYHKGRLNLLRRALDTFEPLSAGRIGMITVRQEDTIATGASGEDMRGFVEFAASVPGVEIAALLHELEVGVEVSLRSTRSHDVSKIARMFGGGGHRNAAGFWCADNINSIKGKLIAYLEPLFAAHKSNHG
jgi:bifunctional oligoribonuclease and PAP phosphatase NrnA